MLPHSSQIYNVIVTIKKSADLCIWEIFKEQKVEIYKTLATARRFVQFENVMLTRFFVFVPWAVFGIWENLEKNLDFAKMTFEKLYFAGGILTFYGLLGIAQEKITKADYGDDKVQTTFKMNFPC